MSCYKIHIHLFSNLLICFWICIVFNSTAQAQSIDTLLHQLNEVSIIENKQQTIETSKKTSSIDSITLARYNTNSIADLLSNQSTIHVKTYGNGNIATTSMRGGNSNHTALLWNGLNIQNAMLGQADLSILPTLFFNDVHLEYGGGSAMWGSGAIGGSIHLQNKTQFNQGFKTKLQISTGSFNTKKIATGVLLSYKRITSNTKIYYNSSKNNYQYKDTTDKENPNKQISHADYIAKGLMQELSFLINSNQTLNIRAWYNNTFRNLPSFTATTSKKHQEDDNLKLNADWNYLKRNLNSTIRIGYFNDQLNYIDSNANVLVSQSKIKTFIIESDNTVNYKNHKINFGINFTNYNSNLLSKEAAKDNLYNYKLSKLAVFVAYKISLFKSKLNYNLAIRKEFNSQTYIPFTGNTGIHYQFLKLFAAKINANKSFRQPTLNDLYWTPGGNPNLKPEDSYEIDGGLELKYKKNNFNILLEGTYFNRHVTNWIIWLPSGNVSWSPKNIAQVYSRGTETKTELSYSKKDIFIKLILNTSYVLSTNQKATSENDNSVGRQLIFTPRYNGQGTLIMSYKKLSLLFNNNYTGYRFTSTDNTSWLNPYYIANFRCSYNYSFSNMNVDVFGNINNLFNKNYVVISNNPMPMRNYEIGIVINYQKQNKKKEPLPIY
ncbi:MAG: TonB-dependent receptor [Bacteroidia bacterium]|nr:TonB-dependent receptor [Bacteroidia bacterium]